MRLRGVRRGAVGVVGARPRALRSRQPLPPSLARRWRRRVCRPCGGAARCRARRLLRQRVQDARQGYAARLRCNLPSRGAGRPRRRPPHRRDQRAQVLRAPPVVRFAPRRARCWIHGSRRPRPRDVSRAAVGGGAHAHRERARRRSRRRHRRVQPVHQHVPARSPRHKRHGGRTDRRRRRTHAALAWAHRSTGAASCGRRRRRRLRQCARPLVRVRLRLRRPRRPPRCDGRRAARHGADGGCVGYARLFGSRARSAAAAASSRPASLRM